jgi:predicted metal-dependent enzyme (double-stranded beta helix superfamily)
MTSFHDVGPGVRVSRRAALRGALALPAFWTLSGCATPRVSGDMPPAAASSDPGGDEVARDEPVGDADVAAFLAEWTAASEAFVADGRTDDDAHLHGLLSELAHIDPQRFGSRQADAFQNDDFTSGPIQGSPHLLVLEFELKPGAVIQPHNHVGWMFVSVGAEGEATARHYEPDGDAPDPGSELHVDFPLREVQRTLLVPGRSSSLTRTRANIHAFRAGPRGARFLDFGVNAKDPAGGYRSFSALEIEEQPQDLRRGVHTARWIGNPYAKD